RTRRAARGDHARSADSQPAERVCGRVPPSAPSYPQGPRSNGARTTTGWWQPSWCLGQTPLNYSDSRQGRYTKGKGEVIQARGGKAGTGPAREAAARRPLDVSGWPQAPEGGRQGLPEARDQGRAAEAEARAPAPLEGGQGQESPFRPQDERCHLHR